MKIKSTYIVLEDMIFHAYHGVMPQETKTGHTFSVQLKIKVDFSKAMQTDDLNDTISYAEVYEVVKEEMLIPSKLIEHAGARIVNRLFSEFGSIEAIKLRLNKINPPMGADIHSSGITINCLRR